MYPFILSSLLILSCCYQSIAQTEIGIEVGHHQTLFLPEANSFTNYFHSAHIGGKVGLFLEREITPSLGIRANLFYDLKYYEFNSSHYFPYTHHAICLPLKAIFKLGKIVHLGIGVEPMLLIPLKKLSATSNKPLFHIGPCAEIGFRIRKMMRLSFYCNYDFMPINYNAYGNYTNLTAGVSFAFVLKKMKKRSVIYSPG